MSTDPKVDRIVLRVSIWVLIGLALVTAAALTYVYNVQQTAHATPTVKDPCLAAIDTSARTHSLYQELVEISADSITAAGDWGTTTLTENAQRAVELDTELSQAFDDYDTHAEDCRGEHQ